MHFTKTIYEKADYCFSYRDSGIHMNTSISITYALSIIWGHFAMTICMHQNTWKRLGLEWPQMVKAKQGPLYSFRGFSLFFKNPEKALLKVVSSGMATGARSTLVVSLPFAPFLVTVSLNSSKYKDLSS